MSPRNSSANGKSRLLTAAQKILAENGIESLNSNAVCELAGVKPPTFYHYFKNKHALLRELGMQMMADQGETLRADTGLKLKTEDELFTAIMNSLEASYRATQSFLGGYALLVSLRALPDLRDIRLKSHEQISEMLAEYFEEQNFPGAGEDILIRVRLGIEFGYAAIEMLFETGFENEQDVLEHTARSILEIYEFF